MEITDMFKDAICGVKTILDIDSVIGTPIVNQENLTVVPITKMSIGFVGMGGELESKFSKPIKDMPLGGIGGGANIQPLGFLVINGNNVKFIGIDKEDGIKWLDYLNTVVDIFSH